VFEIGARRLKIRANVVNDALHPGRRRSDESKSCREGPFLRVHQRSGALDVGSIASAAQ
jgi:hypothetical protein